MPVEIRIEELRHRLHIESAVCEGAKNAVNIIQSSKSDKKALQQVKFNFLFNYSAGNSIFCIYLYQLYFL